LGVLGVGAVACVACCAGPILALLAGGLSAAELASTVFIGGVGVVIVVVAATALLVLRRRRANDTCVVEAAALVPVGAPRRKAPSRDHRRCPGWA
jgi:hypothetical protein